MISGLVTHSSTCLSAIGEPIQEPCTHFQPRTLAPLLRDGLCRAVPMGLRPQTAYPVTLDKGCLPLSLPVCLDGAGAGAGSTAGLGATHAQEHPNL